jgi:hypothetical protein
MACLSAVPAWGAGNLSGQFMLGDNSPMGGALVFFYNLDNGPPPSLDMYWRVPDVVKELDEFGRFKFELPPGNYAIGALKRKGAQQLGPVAEGDIFLLSLDENGVPRNYTVTQESRLDIGVILPPVKIPVGSSPPRITGFDGVVLNAEGKPVEGVMVFAFVTPQVTGKPLYVSERTNKYGHFLLKVHEGGTYYLKLREGYGGGPPKAGTTLDGNLNEPLKAVTVATGQITRGVILKGRTFPGRGSAYNRPGTEKNKQ